MVNPRLEITLKLQVKLSYKSLRKIVSFETFLNYPDFKNIFIVHTYVNEKYMADVLSQNNKPTFFF